MNFTATGPSPLLSHIAAGNPQAILAGCRSLDIRLWVEDGRLRFDAPRGRLAPELMSALVANKAELIVLLIRPPAPPDEPSSTDGEPSIEIPADDWRWRVACLPHDAWSRWRSRSGEIQADFARATGQPLDVGEIELADYIAAEELGIVEGETRMEAA